MGSDERSKTLNAWLFPYSHKQLDIVSLDTIQHLADSGFYFQTFFFFSPEAGDISHYLLRKILCVFPEFVVSSIEKA